jgi:hypothetical protein
MASRLKYVVLFLIVLSGCSVYMEATRPSPIDLAKFNPGDSRGSVTDQLGAPVTTSVGAGGMSCDLYLLYITGYGYGGKVPIAVAEAAADVFTIGLAEIVLSPTESVTRNEKKQVWFCYQNDALVSVTPQSASASPTATATPTPVPSASPAPAGLATPMSSTTPTTTAPSGEE